MKTRMILIMEISRTNIAMIHATITKLKTHSQSNHLRDLLSYFHLNCRGIPANWENFQNLICELQDDTFVFDFIGISELYYILMMAGYIYRDIIL